MKNPKFKVTLNPSHDKLIGGLESKKNRKSKHRGTTTETEMLECIDCNEVKHRDEFYNDALSTNGKQTYCIPCHRERVGLARIGKRINTTAKSNGVVAHDSVVEVKPVGNNNLVEAYRHIHNIHDEVTLDPSEVLNAVVGDYIEVANKSRPMGGAS